MTRLLTAKDGTTYLATANPAAVFAAGPSSTEEGTIESEVLDAGAVSTFGSLQLDGRVPDGSAILVSLRGGSTADPATNPGGWGEWTEPTTARRFQQINLPPARFLQYKLTLRPGSGGASPAVDLVRIAYQPPNRPPLVSGVEVVSELTDLDPTTLAQQALADNSPPSSTRAVSWTAEDPDGDPLTYDVLVRKGRTGGFDLVAEDLAESAYAWDARATGDGVYEVKIVARDAAGNPAGRGLAGERVSQPFTVDLTPPRIGDVSVTRDGDAATAEFRVLDVGGTVLRLEWCLGGADVSEASSWKRAFPVDNMADSPRERYVLRPDGLTAGPRTLRLRAVDDGGNVVYQNLSIPAAD